VDAGERDSGLRLAELVAAFSLATDLGLGQPMEHVLRSWVIAARLGDHLGVEIDAHGALYYVATLAWVGCVRTHLRWPAGSATTSLSGVTACVSTWPGCPCSAS
jgi:hypothetical protein